MLARDRGAARDRRRRSRPRSATAIDGSRSTSTRTRTRCSRRVLDAWLGGRDDLAVVGDEDQTIYTFTGATSDYLTGFHARYPAAQDRAPGEQLPVDAAGPGAGEPGAGGGTVGRATSARPGAVARPAKRLVPTLDGGPAAAHRGLRHGRGGARGRSRPAIRALARDGTAHGEMAILVRTNAQLPALEAGLGAAGIPFHVRGERFFARPEVRRALRVAATPGPAVGRAPRRGGAEPRRRPPGAARRGVRAGARRPPGRDVPDGDAARERHAAVVTLLELAEDLAAADPDSGRRQRSSPRSSGGPTRSRAGRSTASSCSPTTAPRASSGTPSSCRRSRRARSRSARRPSRASSPRSDACCTSASPGRVATCGCRGRAGGPRRPGARAAAAGRASSTASSRRRSGPVRVVPSERPPPRVAAGRPVAALERAPCLAHGACACRRRRAVHRVPRQHDRGDRRPPAAHDPGAAPRAGRRADEARSLRRGDRRDRGRHATSRPRTKVRIDRTPVRRYSSQVTDPQRRLRSSASNNGRSRPRSADHQTAPAPISGCPERSNQPTAAAQAPNRLWRARKHQELSQP